MKQLQAWYGESHILHGVSLEIRPGELVTLLGRNGTGKTTTLRSLLGTGRRRQGSVLVDGTETIRLPPHRIARLGIEIARRSGASSPASTWRRTSCSRRSSVPEE